MRTPFASVAVVVFSFSSVASAAGEGAKTVAEAKKSLDAARAKLDEAIKKVQVDPPVTADLDAALTVIEEFKTAIDFGAAREAEDLDYAKAALAARKELRTQKEYVDQRRARVHIFNQRRVIDAALAKMNEAAKKVQDKEPSTEDFDAARASVKEVKAALDPARQFIPQDQGFATFVTQTDALLAKTGKAIDDRFVLLQADAHRAKVDAARKEMTTAMGALNKNSTDPQFATADAAVVDLEKLLEGGKALESDAKYKALADKCRAEVADARKKKDALWTETGLQRLKNEIEPSYKDLQASLRIVRGKKPSADQLAEARTVSIIVRKLVEQFKPEAERSEQFAAYVETVKASLVEIEAQLALRGLDGAKRDVLAAQRKVERLTPTDDDFAEMNSALLVLEKTLEPLNPKDPLISATVLEAKQLLHDGKLIATRRRNEVDVEKQKAVVEKARTEAATLMDKLSQATSEEVPMTEASLAEIEKALAPGEELTKRDRGYAAYDREVKKRLEAMRAKIAKRKEVLAALETKAKLVNAVAMTKTLLETAKLPSSTDAEVAAASKQLDGTLAMVEQNQPVEQLNAQYAAAAERARNDLLRLQEGLMIAQAQRDLRKKTGDALAAAEQAFAAASGSKDLRVQKTNYEKALSLFKQCVSDGNSTVEGNPMLVKTVVLVDGAPNTPKQVTTLCGKRADDTVPLIKPIAGLIAFEEGPKKSYEKAKAFMEKSKKTEALAEFDECTATGVTLQYRNPELKERSFEVAGTTITLSELTKVCSAQSKALRGK